MIAPDFARMGLELGIGLAVGVLSGLLGIGGGALLVPAAVFVLAVDQHTAQGISLAVIVPTAIAGALTHHRQGFVIPKIAMIAGPASIISALVFAQIAGMLDGLWLSRAFGSFIVLIGIKTVLGK